MFAVLLLACSTSSPVVGETLTDDGTWQLTLGATEYDQGTAHLDVTAREADGGEPALGLTIFARPGMDTMQHSLSVTEFGDVGDGGYAAEVLFDMSGIWTLTGYAGDDVGSEGFTFVVEVNP